MPSTSLAGCSILIMDNEPLVAFDLAATCEKAGAKTVIAISLNKALAVIDAGQICSAIVGVGFVACEADALIARLTEKGIPFVVHTTFLKDPFPGAIIVPRPSPPHRLLDALSRVVENCPYLEKPISISRHGKQGSEGASR
jgi:hypothetical protein